jgi:hypothetical protein
MIGVMVPNSINPYEAPQSLDQVVAAPQSADRSVARKNIHHALLILLIPALWNYGCLFWPDLIAIPRYSGKPVNLDPVARAASWGSFVLIAVTFIGLGLFALKILDGIAIFVHRCVGGQTTRTAWLESMYFSLWTLRWASRLGAVWWIVWLIVFFYARAFDPFWTCFIMGTVGHLIGAWVYGTIFYNWYRLRHATPSVADQA